VHPCKTAPSRGFADHPAGESLLYSFTPKPAGTRGTQPRHGDDGPQSQHVFGEFGFLIIDPARAIPVDMTAK